MRHCEYCNAPEDEVELLGMVSVPLLCRACIKAAQDPKSDPALVFVGTVGFVVGEGKPLHGGGGDSGKEQ